MAAAAELLNWLTAPATQFWKQFLVMQMRNWIFWQFVLLVVFLITDLLFKKGSSTRTILYLKCPRCQKGATFETKNWLHKKPFKMKAACASCGLELNKTAVHPLGTICIMCILVALYAMVLAVLFHRILGWPPATTIGVMALSFVFLLPYVFRVSKLTLLSYRIKYDPNIVCKSEN